MRAAVVLRAETSVEIDLQEQRAYLLRQWAASVGSRRFPADATDISPRPVRSKFMEKERNSLFEHLRQNCGRVTDRHVVADADADMQVPRGCRFVPAPMHYFMRFHGADGMHAGYLPGYPASHGCVRMPEQYAIAFFNSVSVGTPVTVFGRTPTGRYLGQSQSPFMRGGNRFADPRFSRRFDPRFGPPPPPWWR